MNIKLCKGKYPPALDCWVPQPRCSGHLVLPRCSQMGLLRFKRCRFGVSIIPNTFLQISPNGFPLLIFSRKSSFFPRNSIFSLWLISGLLVTSRNVSYGSEEGGQPSVWSPVERHIEQYRIVVADDVSCSPETTGRRGRFLHRQTVSKRCCQSGGSEIG